MYIHPHHSNYKVFITHLSFIDHLDFFKAHLALASALIQKGVKVWGGKARSSTAISPKKWMLGRVTLPETNSKFAPENRPKPNRKRESIPIHPFLGARNVSFREGKAFPFWEGRQATFLLGRFLFNFQVGEGGFGWRNILQKLGGFLLEVKKYFCYLDDERKKYQFALFPRFLMGQIFLGKLVLDQKTMVFKIWDPWWKENCGKQCS